MPTLCFGGTFNPIHNGHLVCAQAVAKKAGYERVLLIPANQPPHKQGAELTSADDRLAMCRLAAQDNALFDVSDIETRRSGPSYTIDTARQILLKQGDTAQNRVHWLIGSDMLMYLPKWHQIEQLLNEVHFVVMARPGWVMDWDALPAQFRQLRSHVVDAPLIDITASEIRRRVRSREAIDTLVPIPVAGYITEKHLYRR